MKLNKAMIFARRAGRRLFRRTFPVDARQLEAHWLINGWWYYTIELLPGIIAKGQYPDDFPFLPRMLLRNCNLQDMTCLDLGSMEGLVPVLMCRKGAKSVLATDAVDHCHDKMAAVRQYYRADFGFRSVGPMYDLSRKLRGRRSVGFDLINLSGLLYHVFSPLMVLAGVRPLLRKHGLMIVSTNVVETANFSMELNNSGRLQDETNTFWYMSINALDYLLRYLKLAPIDCLYLSHRDISSPVRYVSDIESGYLSVVCRATDDVLATSDDRWMAKSARESWEYLDLVDWRRAVRQGTSDIAYTGKPYNEVVRSDTGTMHLTEAVRVKTVRRATHPQDAHVLRLTDQS
jgi:2-polyprenyl-3-methyl-5-hydroxy-6-metoxy-1,4-benzoquinol methylase